MSSDLQSAYKALLINNYISLIGCVIVGYDYILTFSKEIDYIWCRRWTWVTAIFALVRYPGLCWAMLGGLIGSSFIPGPLNMLVNQLIVHNIRVNVILLLVSCWTFPVFICAADLVMVLRVYTMWNRSRTVLYVLLFFFMLQLVVSVVLPAIYNSSSFYFSASTFQVLNFTVCGGSFIPSVPALLGVYCAIPRFLVSVILLMLAISRTFRQLLDMYKATKLWQPNRYMNQFARDGIFYFVVNTFYNVLVTATATPAINTPPIVINVLVMLSTSLLCCAMPRFIIDVRELYDRDLRGRWQGVDTGFGAMSRPGFTGGQGQISTIAFMERGQEESRTLQDDGDMLEGIQLEGVEECSHQV